MFLCVEHQVVNANCNRIDERFINRKTKQVFDQHTYNELPLDEEPREEVH